MKDIAESGGQTIATKVFNSNYCWLLKELILQGIFYKLAYIAMENPDNLSGVHIYDRHYIGDTEDIIVTGVPDQGEIDELVDTWYKSILGSSDDSIAFPIKRTSPLDLKEHCAVSLGSVNSLKIGETKNGLIGRKYWVLNERLETKAHLVRNGEKFIVKVLNFRQILCYKSDTARLVRKAISKAKSVQVLGCGAELDLSGLGDLYSLGKSINTLNEMIKGEFGAEGVLFALQNIFRGSLKISVNSPVKCFIPEGALLEKGIMLTSFMPANVISNAAFISEGGSMYWVPGEGLNRFKLDVSAKDKMAHMVEDKLYSGEPDTIIGCVGIPFKVGYNRM